MGAQWGYLWELQRAAWGPRSKKENLQKKKKQHPKNTPPKQPFPFYFLTLMARRLGNGSGVFFTSFQIFPGLH